MNYALGGAFNSRINLNLREDKGYTYGARSGFSGGKHAGPFTAQAGVRANVTDSSLVEFIKELKNYGNGISEAELAFMKSSIGQSDARKYETAFQKAGFLRRIIDYKLDKSYVKKQQEILKNITKEEIDALIKKYIDLNKMVILVVGDEDEVLEKINKLGFGEATVLDTNGNPEE
jgi:zinc protease